MAGDLSKTPRPRWKCAELKPVITLLLVGTSMAMLYSSLNTCPSPLVIFSLFFKDFDHLARFRYLNCFGHGFLDVNLRKKKSKEKTRNIKFALN